MKIRLPEHWDSEAEDGGGRVIDGKFEDPRNRTTAAAPEATVPPVPATPSLEMTIKGALNGTLVRGRPLDFGELKTLNPVHIAAIIDRAAGMRVEEIAEKYDWQEQWVRKMLRHPDAETIVGRILSSFADQAADPIARLQGYAHEAITTKVNIMRNSRSEVLRDRVASDLLNRAGYGARIMVDMNQTGGFNRVAEEQPQLLHRIAEALDESNTAGASADYSKYVNKAPLDSAVQQGTAPTPADIGNPSVHHPDAAFADPPAATPPDQARVA